MVLCYEYAIWYFIRVVLRNISESHFEAGCSSAFETITDEVGNSSTGVAAADFSSIVIEIHVDAIALVHASAQTFAVVVEVVGDRSLLYTADAVAEVGYVSVLYGRVAAGIILNVASGVVS